MAKHHVAAGGICGFSRAGWILCYFKHFPEELRKKD